MTTQQITRRGLLAAGALTLALSAILAVLVAAPAPTPRGAALAASTHAVAPVRTAHAPAPGKVATGDVGDRRHTMAECMTLWAFAPSGVTRGEAVQECREESSTPAPVAEDSPAFDCHRDGNGVCGPLTVEISPAGHSALVWSGEGVALALVGPDDVVRDTAPMFPGAHGGGVADLPESCGYPSPVTAVIISGDGRAALLSYWRDERACLVGFGTVTADAAP